MPEKNLVEGQKRLRQICRKLNAIQHQQKKQVAVEAKAKQEEGKNQYSLSSNLNEPSEPIHTASKAAESIGVSENTYLSSLADA